MTDIDKYGFEVTEKEWQDIKDKEGYCENCYDGSYFPASDCRGCWFFNHNNPNRVFCVECLNEVEQPGLNGCKLNPGSCHGMGWGCDEGKKKGCGN